MIPLQFSPRVIPCHDRAIQSGDGDGMPDVARALRSASHLFPALDVDAMLAEFRAGGVVDVADFDGLSVEALQEVWFSCRAMPKDVCSVFLKSCCSLAELARVRRDASQVEERASIID